MISTLENFTVRERLQCIGDWSSTSMVQIYVIVVNDSLEACIVKYREQTCFLFLGGWRSDWLQRQKSGRFDAMLESIRAKIQSLYIHG